MDLKDSGISSVEVKKNNLEYTKPERNIIKTVTAFVQFAPTPTRMTERNLQESNQSCINYGCKLSGQ